MRHLDEDSRSSPPARCVRGAPICWPSASTCRGDRHGDDGLICAWFQHRVLGASARLYGTGFWSVTIFILEAFVFLIIGSSLHELIQRGDGADSMLAEMGVPVLIVVLAVILARFAWVCVGRRAHAVAEAGRDPLPSARAGRCHGIELGRHARVITLALAASLPESFPGATSSSSPPLPSSSPPSLCRGSRSAP